MVEQRFKGVIATGTIEAELESDTTNADTDLLVISYGPLADGEPRVDRTVVAPGGAGAVSVAADADGILEVWVSIGADGDSGTLRVHVDGVLRDEESIQSSVRWGYSVQG